MTLHDAFVAEGCGGKAAPQTGGLGRRRARSGAASTDAVTTEGRALCAGRRLPHGRGGGPRSAAAGSEAGRRPMASRRQAFWKPKSSPRTGRVKIGQRLLQSRPLLGAQGRGRRLWRHHPTDAEDARSAVLSRRGLHRSSKPVRTTRGAASSRRIVDFYAEALFNPHWGEQIGFRAGGERSSVSMTFEGLDQGAGRSHLAPFPRLGRRVAAGFRHTVAKPMIIAAPARQFWNPAVLKSHSRPRPRPTTAPARRPGNIFWAANRGECGSGSAQLPVGRGCRPGCSKPTGARVLVDALVAAAATHWGVTLHALTRASPAPRARRNHAKRWTRR